MRALGVLGVVGLIALLLFVQHRYFPRVDVLIERDTIWERRDSVIYVEKPIPYEVIIPPDTIYIPSVDEELIALYKHLHTLYHTERKYSERMNIDTIGFIYSSFSVFKNEAIDYKLGYELNIPTIRETIIKYDTRPFYTVGIVGSRERLLPLIGVGKGSFSVEVGWNKDVYVGIRYKASFEPLGAFKSLR
jgi:hypothetical protein